MFFIYPEARRSDDAEVGTFYNYFRDYDLATGRYLQSDPIGLDGGLNTYGYVRGNPLLSSDPFGLYATTANPGWIGGSAGIGSGAATTCLAIASRIFSGAAGLIIPSSMGCDPVIECSNDCSAIIAQTRIVKERYVELLEDQHGLYKQYKGIRNPHPKYGSWEGHIRRYRAEQDELKALIAQAGLKCQPYISQEFLQWQYMPPPNNPNRPYGAQLRGAIL